MHFTLKSLRAVASPAVALTLCLTPNLHAEPTMPETPADVAAAPADAAKTASGLASKVLTKGSGTKKPAAADTVTVHYSGWTTDGKLFDSSVQRGSSTSFPLNGVIKGWTEGLQLMVIGEKRRFWIPAALAYGEKTASGLASKVLTKGSGASHPKATDRVEVHYSGWTTDGKLFDSSVVRGKSITFGLDQVIPGWTEGVQLMVEGEKRRLWIPAALGYGENPGGGRPGGLLVFDVELIKIEK